MTDAELIARLRGVWRYKDLHLCPEAADRIEALSISNATLIAERDEALEWLSASQGYIADAVYALDKQEAAEAKLAKAVEALEYYAVEAMPWEADDSLIARAALARVKGVM